VSDAEVSYRRAVELAPSAVEPRMRLGELLARTERDDEAIVELSIVRRLAPHESEALSALGALYLERRRCREAADILGDATRVSHPARALTLLGIAYECLGDIESARTAYRRAIEAAPDSAAGAVARDHLSRVG
jgi:Flp pilus assembly protein TadD